MSRRRRSNGCDACIGGQQDSYASKQTTTSEHIGSELPSSGLQHNTMSRRRRMSGCDACDGGQNSYARKQENTSQHLGLELLSFGEVLASFDRCTQEIEALTLLKRTAEEHYQRAFDIEEAEEEKGEHALLGGMVWVRIVEAETPLVEGHFGGSSRRISIELESEGQRVCSTSRPGAAHIIWNEAYRLPLHHEAIYDPDVNLHVAFLCDGEHAHIRIHKEQLHDLYDQKARHTSCSFPDGWRVQLVIQWIHSASHLLRDHADEFEVKLKASRAELLACQNRLEKLVPGEIWRNERE